MSPVELKEERESLERSFQALKTIFGELLLETAQPDPTEVAYYQRKFREAQDNLQRCGR